MVAIERELRSTPAPAVGADRIPLAARRRTGSPRQVFVACAVGAIVLALFGAPDLPTWAEQLHDGAMTTVLRRTASRWEEEVSRMGLAAPHRAVRRGVRWLIERQWP